MRMHPHALHTGCLVDLVYAAHLTDRSSVPSLTALSSLVGVLSQWLMHTGLVWCGVLWCGAVRCGAVWCSVMQIPIPIPIPIPCSPLPIPRPCSHPRARPPPHPYPPFLPIADAILPVPCCSGALCGCQCAFRFQQSSAGPELCGVDGVYEAEEVCVRLRARARLCLCVYRWGADWNRILTCVGELRSCSAMKVPAVSA